MSYTPTEQAIKKVIRDIFKNDICQTFYMKDMKIIKMKYYKECLIYVYVGNIHTNLIYCVDIVNKRVRHITPSTN